MGERATLEGDTDVVRALIAIRTDCVTDKLAGAVAAGLHAVAGVTVVAVVIVVVVPTTLEGDAEVVRAFVTIVTAH